MKEDGNEETNSLLENVVAEKRTWNFQEMLKAAASDSIRQRRQPCIYPHGANLLIRLLQV
jgi:hypothetical protein